MSPAPVIHIMLVEDNLADVELTLEALEEAKFANAVTVMRDGSEALDYLHRRSGHEDSVRPDLIILDLNLPRRSGHEVLADLKVDASLRRIPVAILTTSSAESDVLASYDLGANCFLTKPVDVGQFLKVVKSIEDFWFGVVRLPPR